MWQVRELELGSRAIPYLEALELQRLTHREVVTGAQPDTLLLLEHEHVYTAGKRTEPSELPADGSLVVPVDRGGKITWHGPGQLVGYPIVRLPDPIDVVAHVRRLERLIIDVVSKFGVDAHQVDGRSGVWVGPAGFENKIAAIGVRVAEGVTMHGFSINCNNTLDAYQSIVACGIRDAGVTTISIERGNSIDVQTVAEKVKALLPNHITEEIRA